MGETSHLTIFSAFNLSSLALLFCSIAQRSTTDESIRATRKGNAVLRREEKEGEEKRKERRGEERKGTERKAEERRKGKSSKENSH